MIYYNRRRPGFYSLIVLILLFCPFSGFASGEKTEKFDPGTFIVSHITDSYGWHSAGEGEKSIGIPLPVILIDNGKPVFFMSNKFHHGHAAYHGYALGFTPETKGGIVKLGGEHSEYTGLLEENKTYLLDTQASLIDVSITKNVCALFISIILLSIIFLSVAKQYKRREGKAPKGLQSLLEPVILFIRDEIAIPSIGEKKYKKYLPYLLTLFFFILFNNLMGLIPIFPGGANLTGNLAVTGVLALLTFLITTFSGNKNYWKHIFNTPGVPWWLKFPVPLMPIVELIGIFTKPFVLMIRLFANITAGHIIILGFLGLIFIFGEMTPALGYGVSVVSIIFYLFMGLLELIVAFVQAFVFTLLTALYVGLAIEEHHEEAIPTSSTNENIEQKP